MALAVGPICAPRRSASLHRRLLTAGTTHGREASAAVHGARPSASRDAAPHGPASRAMTTPGMSAWLRSAGWQGMGVVPGRWGNRDAQAVGSTRSVPKASRWHATTTPLPLPFLAAPEHAAPWPSAPCATRWAIQNMHGARMRSIAQLARAVATLRELATPPEASPLSARSRRGGAAMGPLSCGPSLSCKRTEWPKRLVRTKRCPCCWLRSRGRDGQPTNHTRRKRVQNPRTPHKQTTHT